MFVNSWRRSRVILIDEHFKPIFNRITHAAQAMIREMSNVELVVRAMRNNSESAMLRMLSLLESRNCLGISWRKVNPAKVCTNGDWMFFSIPNYVIKKVRPRGARYGKAEAQKEHFLAPQCSEEMYQKEIWRNSRSLPAGFNISWFATQSWLDRGKVHRDGQISTGKPLLLPILWGVREIQRKIGISHWTNQAEMHRWNSDQTSEKHLQICTVSTVNLEKSDLDQFLFIKTKGGIRRPLHSVPHGGSGMNIGKAHKLKIVIWARERASSKNRETCSVRLLIKKLRVAFWQDFFICCSHYLQLIAICCNRRRVWTEHPDTSHFLVCHSTHFNVVRDIGSSSRCGAHFIPSHPCFMRSGCLDTSSTLHSSPSLSSPLSFSWFSPSSSSSMWVGSTGTNTLCHFREWGLRHFGRKLSSHMVVPIRPWNTGATGRFSWVIREEESGIPSKTHAFDDSVILTTRRTSCGSASASSGNRATWACCPDTRESERVGARGKKHVRETRLQQVGSGGVQRQTWRTIVGLH